MTASKAWWAYGSKLQIGNDGSSETFATVAELLDLAGPNMTKDGIEVTNHDSDDGWKERLPGFRDGGDVSFSANWLPQNATQDGVDGVLSKFDDDELHNWKIVTAGGNDGTEDGIEIEFAAFVSQFAPTMPLTEQGKVNIGLSISGPVTFDGS